MAEGKMKHFEVILQSVGRIQTELDDLKKWIDSQIFEDKMLSERNNPRRTRNRNRRKNSVVMSKKKPNIDDENEILDGDVEVKCEINDDEFALRDYDNDDFNDDQEMSNYNPTTTTTTTTNKKNKRSCSTTSQNQNNQEDKELGEVDDDDDDDEDYDYDEEVSNSKRKSARISHNWTLLKTVSIIEEFDEIDDWAIEFTKQLKTGKCVYYYCKEGGRFCPSKVKFVYQSEQFGIDIYDNNNEHEHNKEKREMKRKKNSSSQMRIEKTNSNKCPNTRSFIWNHFTKIEINNKMKVVCNTCNKEHSMPVGGGTGNYKLHLINHHPELIFPN